MKFLNHHEYVSIANQNASHRMILLHGWGADAYDLLPLAKEIVGNMSLNFEIISLRAPNINPENNSRQWYGLFPANWNEAKKEVENLVLTLKEFGNLNIPTQKTILLGFSQGAAMAIDAGQELDLGLVIACSGYLHPNCKIKKDHPYILLSHGLKDEIVPFSRSKEIYEKLQVFSKTKSEIYEFDGHHEIDFNLISVVKEKINQIF